MGHVRRLIVFDLDGTLVDSRRDLADAANALIEERGGRPLPDAAIARMVGEGAALLVRRALTAAGLPFDDESVPRFLALYDERLVATTRPYPGMVEALRAMAPLAPMAVLTNKPVAPARALVEALDLAPFLETVVGGDGPWPRKPDPASLMDLMRRFDAPPEGTVLVGDSRIDLETAHAAGVPLLLARWGFGADGVAVSSLRPSDTSVARPADLPPAVRDLFARRSH
jgi:phosphoglycolate phosphatase